MKQPILFLQPSPQINRPAPVATKRHRRCFFLVELFLTGRTVHDDYSNLNHEGHKEHKEGRNKSISVYSRFFLPLFRRYFVVQSFFLLDDLESPDDLLLASLFFSVFFSEDFFAFSSPFLYESLR